MRAITADVTAADVTPTAQPWREGDICIAIHTNAGGSDHAVILRGTSFTITKGTTCVLVFARSQVANTGPVWTKGASILTAANV
jgi:hypothetical protein